MSVNPKPEGQSTIRKCDLIGQSTHNIELEVSFKNPTKNSEERH
jgi:hypothetical protein